MFLIEKTNRRRTYKVYTSASPIFGLIMALFGVFVTVKANLGAGALIILLGGGFAFACASVWVFDKNLGRVVRALNLRRYSIPLWQRPLDEISAVEIKGTITKDGVGTPIDNTRTGLLFKSGERRSLWSEYGDRSRDLARFLSVNLTEEEAEKPL
ncbi:MAG: hypothetical protein ABI700_18820 [Chloroflexota bacterium]